MYYKIKGEFDEVCVDNHTLKRINEDLLNDKKIAETKIKNMDTNAK
jgi:hypothetical protein